MFITELMKVKGITISIADGLLVNEKNNNYKVSFNGFEYDINKSIAEIFAFIGKPQGTSLKDVRDKVSDYHDASQLILVVANLIYWNNFIISISHDNKPMVSICNSAVGGENIELADDVLPNQRLFFSRFTSLAREDDKLFLSRAMKDKRFLVEDDRLDKLFFALFYGTTLADIFKQYDATMHSSITLIIRLFLGEEFVVSSEKAPSRIEEGTDVDTQWDVADLNFHSKSRFGYHFGDFGGAFPFVNIIKPRPSIRDLPDGKRIDLYKPNIEELMESDATLTQLQMRRLSIREYNEKEPISLKQVGEFLYRTSRILFSSQMQVTNAKDETQKTDMELSWRPYPTGGASYELELYLTVDRATDLDRGMYYYSPKTHQLIQISGPTVDTDSLIDTAYASCARIVKPQVLIHIAARFQRVSWKYHAIAYATTLRNTGVLYQTFYLNAIAMGIAPCGLGSGDIKTFAKASKNDPTVESNVGEFMIGSLPKGFDMSKVTQDFLSQMHSAVLAGMGKK